MGAEQHLTNSALCVRVYSIYCEGRRYHSIGRKQPGSRWRNTGVGVYTSYACTTSSTARVAIPLCLLSWQSVPDVSVDAAEQATRSTGAFRLHGLNHAQDLAYFARQFLFLS